MASPQSPRLASPQEIQRALSALRARLQSRVAASPAPSPRITTVAVSTCRRPAMLADCLASIATNLDQFGRAPRVVVFDDSRAPEERTRNREVIALVTAEYGRAIAYSGHDERRAFIARLASHPRVRGAVDPALIEFALMDLHATNLTAGANHNAEHLATAGECSLTLDDDMRFYAFRGKAPRDGALLSTMGALLDLWQAPDRQSALAMGTPVTVDVLAAHESLLGRDLDDAVIASARPEDVAARDVGEDLLGMIEKGDARVAVTMGGFAGDSGMSSPTFLLTLQGPTREHLVSDPERYRLLRTSRNLLRVAPCTTLSDRPFWMSALIAQDHRLALPPYFPALRNGDGLFGSVLRRCYLTSLIGHVPYAYAHRPPEDRAYPPDALWAEQASLGSDDVTQGVMSQINMTFAGRDPLERMHALGRHLERFGSMPQAAFSEWLAHAAREVFEPRKLALEQLLRAHRESPPHWAEDVRRTIAVIERGLAHRGPIVPREAQRAANGRDPIALQQALIRDYGRLLQCWPTLFEAAREMNAEGEGLLESAAP